MKPRKYSPTEISAGMRAAQVLADRVQWHAGDCPCALCMAWLALRPVEVYGIDAQPAVKTEEKA